MENEEQVYVYNYRHTHWEVMIHGLSVHTLSVLLGWIYEMGKLLHGNATEKSAHPCGCPGRLW